ncbi:MAG: PTS sugar transporter subunit IIA [Siculibacillus sp.]
MDLGHLLELEAVLPIVRAASKKQALQEIAVRAARLTGHDEIDVFERLSHRERLGSTGIGHGIAIPHADVPGLERTVGIFARLERPVDFEAIDEQPVDLLFTLLSPIGAGADHLKALARVARVLRDAAMVAKLRATADPAALWAVLTLGAGDGRPPRAPRLAVS